MTNFPRLMAVGATLWLCANAVCASDMALDSKLQSLFATADRNNTSIKSFQSEVENADAAISVAQSAWLPQIEAQASVSYIGNGHIWDRDFKNGMNVDMPHFGNNFSIKAQQVVYSGGAITTGIELAKKGRRMAEISEANNRQSVHFLITGYYLQLHNLLNQQRVYDENIKLTEKLIEQTRTRNEQGVVLRNDVTRYELQLENLRLAKTHIADSYQIVSHQLLTAIGSDCDITTTENVDITSCPLLSEADWQSLAADNHLGIQQANLGVDMNRLKVKMEKAERLPKVAVVLEDHLDGPILIEVPTIDKNFNYWFAGIGVSYNVSSLFTSNKKIRQAEVATRTSESQLSELSENIENAVNAAWTTYKTSFTELNTRQKSVELAQQNYDVIANRYNNGLALVTDMVDASNMLLNAQLELVNSRINVVYKYYNLKYISGTL